MLVRSKLRAAVSCGAVCAHARGQDACAAELMLPPPLPRIAATCANCACWDGGRDDELPSAKGEKYTRTPGWIEAATAICAGGFGRANATTHDLRCRSSPRIAGMADLTETQRTRGPSATTYADAASPALRGGCRLHRTVWAPHILISVCSFTVISSSFCVAFERVAFSHIKIASGHIK